MTSFPKKDVVRFVAANGKPLIDPTGKLNGRGAYLCRSLECFDVAMKKKRLTHAIGVTMAPDEIAGLRVEYAELLTGAEVNE